MKNFAVIGLGFISLRHIRAIKDIGGRIVCVCDIDENKKNIVPLCYDIRNIYGFVFIPAFYQDWKKMMKSRVFERVDYVVILTPNHLHFEMIKEARKRGKKVICEKPLVTSIDELAVLVDDNEIYATLQLRYGCPIIKKNRHPSFNEIWMNIEVHRGDWYYKSWKVNKELSGGLLFNIGIHYFDLLLSEFRDLKITEISRYDNRKIEGILECTEARIKWRLRIDAPIREQKREIIFRGKEPIDLTRFSYGKTEVEFANLHTKVYEDIMKGKGIRPKDLMRVTKLAAEMTEESRR